MSTRTDAADRNRGYSVMVPGASAGPPPGHPVADAFVGRTRVRGGEYTSAEADQLWGRQIHNPSIFDT